MDFWKNAMVFLCKLGVKFCILFTKMGKKISYTFYIIYYFFPEIGYQLNYFCLNWTSILSRTNRRNVVAPTRTVVFIIHKYNSHII